MPELPEVEVAARNLRRWTAGRRIRAVQAGSGGKRIFRPASPSALAGLRGLTFRDLRRVGKNLLITLEGRDGPVGLWSHLGMTGKWLHRAAGAPEPRAARLALELDDGSRVYYVDPRMFGRVRLVPGARFDDLPEVAALGPDPLVDGIDPAALHRRLARIKAPIKVAILDQTLLPGVGNIQASEGLFRAGIDPRRPALSLSRAEVGRLARGLLASIRFTLSTFARDGFDEGDADISYVEERQIENPFLVYGRAGEPCPRCKKKERASRAGARKIPAKTGQKTDPSTVITRIVQAQRATFFCAACQS
jgi:formamidopyrimidine-DNA glycosylase